MKLIISFVLTVLMMLFLSEASAQIRLQPLKISPPLNPGSTNLNLKSSNQPQGSLFKPLPPMPETPSPETPLLETPPAQVPEQNFSTGPLPPGVYETRPYAGIVIVPVPQHDDSSVLGPGSMYPSSRMPVIHPHVEAIPKRQTKP